MDEAGTWHGGRPQPRRFFVRWEPIPQKETEPPPQFTTHFYCGKTAECINMPFGMEVGFSPGDFVLDGDPATYPKRGGAPPNFDPRLLWPNGCMDQDATWYGDRPRPTRHCVRCGPSYPQKKGHTYHHPIFGPCLLWPNGWMDEDAAWYRSRPRFRPHCTRRGTSQLARKGHSSPHFRPMSIVATVAHLSYC